MRRFPDASRPRSNESSAAFTVIELVISMGLGLIVLAAAWDLFLYTNRSFVGLANHVELARANRNAMDVLSQKIRQVNSLTSYSTNSLTFRDYDGNALQVVYNPVAQTLSWIKQGATNVLLTSCIALNFSLFQENIASGSLNATNTATNAASCKIVTVNWTTSMKLLNLLTNSEEIKCAKIVIRAKN